MEINELIKRKERAEKALNVLKSFLSHPRFYYNIVGEDDDAVSYMTVSSSIKPHIRHLFKKDKWEDVISYYYLPSSKLEEAYNILKKKNVKFLTLEQSETLEKAIEKIKSFISTLHKQILLAEEKEEREAFDYVKSYLQNLENDFVAVNHLPRGIKFSKKIFEFTSPYTETHEVLIESTEDGKIIQYFHKFVDEYDCQHFVHKSIVNEIEEEVKREEEERKRRIEEEEKRREEEIRLMREIEEKKKRVLAVLNDFGDIFDIKNNDFSLEVRFNKFIPQNQFNEIISVLKSLGFTFLAKSKTWYKSF